MSEKKHAEEEGGGHSVGLWYVSFSDMITLLLSFFVMLTSFSSFDKASKQKFRGVIESIASSSILPGKDRSMDSFLPPPDHFDRTDRGSEAPTDHSPDRTEKPKHLPWIAQTEAYRNQKVFGLPSDQVFWGHGSSITPKGRTTLGIIAEFIRRMPCQVVIAEEAPEGLDQAMRLERIWAVRDFFAVDSSLPADWFSISATDLRGLPQRAAGQGRVEIRLISRSIKP